MTKRGFTLVELLIVIAILAVLAGILFTVFAPAKEKARQTHCMNNLKQLGAAILLYKTDYDGGWPLGLTTIYPAYVPNQAVFVCPDDCAPEAIKSQFVNRYGVYTSYTMWGDSMEILSRSRAASFQDNTCEERALRLAEQRSASRLPLVQCCCHLLPGFYCRGDHPNDVLEFHERLRDDDIRSAVLRIEQDGHFWRQRMPEDCDWLDVCTCTAMVAMTRTEWMALLNQCKQELGCEEEE